MRDPHHMAPGGEGEMFKIWCLACLGPPITVSHLGTMWDEIPMSPESSSFKMSQIRCNRSRFCFFGICGGSPSGRGSSGPGNPHTGCPPMWGPHHMVPGGEGEHFQNLVFGLFRASDYGLRARVHVGCDPHVPRMEQFQDEPNLL